MNIFFKSMTGVSYYLVSVMILLSACSAGEKIIFSSASSIVESSAEKLLLQGCRNHKGQKTGLLLDLKQGKIVRRIHGNKPAIAGPALKPVSGFSVKGDRLIFRKKDGRVKKVFILELPVHASPKAGMLVSRFHGKRGYFMRIAGVYPGGVLVREPRRFMTKGGGYADAYYPLSPEGEVGAEISSEAFAGKHKALFLTSRGILLVAFNRQEGGEILRAYDSNTGKIVFEIE